MLKNVGNTLWNNKGAIAGSFGAGLAGMYIGARFHEHQLMRMVVFRMENPIPVLNKDDPKVVLNAAVDLANLCGGLAVLSTRSERDIGRDEVDKKLGVSSRLMQLLPVTIDNNLTPQLIFHTSALTRKAEELSEDPRCTLSFVDNSKIICITFSGWAERLKEAEEKYSIKNWPLFPPLSYVYGDEDAIKKEFTAWRIHADKIQVECPALGLTTLGRSDWQSPTLESRCMGGWELVVPPGEQGDKKKPKEDSNTLENKKEPEVAVENASSPSSGEDKRRFKLPFFGK